jgi:uncharacterized protein YacL
VTLIILLPTALALLVMVGDTFWQRKNLQSLGGLFFGVLAGLALAYVLGVVVNLIGGIFTANPEQDTYVQMARVIVGALTVYLCASFVMQTKDDFRFVVPYVEFTKQTKGSRPTLLDTSVIIDGRIADIAETRVDRGRAGGAALRAGRTAGHRRLGRQAQAQPRAARAGRAEPPPGLRQGRHTHP